MTVHRRARIAAEYREATGAVAEAVTGLWISTPNINRCLSPPLPAAVVRRGNVRVLCVVRDHNGQKLAYVYFENEPGRRSAAKLLTRDEARRIASNIAKLPELLQTK